MSDTTTTDVNSSKTSSASLTAKFLSALRGGSTTQTGGDQAFASALDEVVFLSTQKADDISARRDMAPVVSERVTPRPRDDKRQASETDIKTRKVDDRDSRANDKKDDAVSTVPREKQDRTEPMQKKGVDKKQQVVQTDVKSETKGEETETQTTDESVSLLQSVLTDDATKDDKSALIDGAKEESTIMACDGAASQLKDLAQAEKSALEMLKGLMVDHGQTQENDGSDEESDRVTLGDVLAEKAAQNGSSTKTNSPIEAPHQTARDKLNEMVDPMQDPTQHAAKKSGSNLSFDSQAQQVASPIDSRLDEVMSKADLIKMAKQDVATQSSSQTTGQNSINNLQSFATQTMNGGAKDASNLQQTAVQVQGVTTVGTTEGTTLHNASGRMAGLYETNAPMHAVKSGPSSQLSIVEQVSVQLHKTVKAGSDQMTLQLRPEELGRIDVKLEFGADKSVTGKVIVDNPATYDLLTKDASSLQRALQDAGLQADAGCLQFSLRGDGQQNTASHGQSGRGSMTHNNAQLEAENDNTTASSQSATETYYLTPNRVNLRV